MTIQSDLMAAGREALETLVSFTKYEMHRVFGRVFWLKTDIEVEVSGIWHDAVNQDQTEIETQAKATISFTTSKEIAAFSELKSTELWLANYRDYWFSPTRRGRYNEIMGVYHYYGDNAYSQFRRLFVETDNDLLNLKPFTSNSLLFWLDLDLGLPLYPAFLIPTNLSEPYIVLSIKESKNLTSGLFVNKNGERVLSRFDKIKLTVFNADIELISLILEKINNNGIVTGTFGISNYFEINDIDYLVQSENNTQAICTELIGEIHYILTIKTTNTLKAIESAELVNWFYMPMITTNETAIIDYFSNHIICDIDTNQILINGV